ncbi:hypothetical protein FHR81_005040 [Actinoalloteichus hoggarensis]|uniref:hypothetical protein n=1 Tax=Actinoalloteichus hoggarensis TaxID=1470176 RepID=UPI0012FE5114|nr:hypothetical protein [Actinoalloteichus hoggarensis]MBB5923963.1 hypothetical protein [Actinoalloteichus hoggarensis]
MEADEGTPEVGARLMADRAVAEQDALSENLAVTHSGHAGTRGCDHAPAAGSTTPGGLARVTT